MNNNTYFEQLCKDVYGYYGILRNVDPLKHSLVMLRSMGEFWTEKDIKKYFVDNNRSGRFLNFTEFRRLAKLKWYEPTIEQNQENQTLNEDGYGNQIYMHPGDISRFKSAFDRVSEFYTGNSGVNKSIPTRVLHNMLTNYEDPMPKTVANYFISKLDVYNNEVTSRALLCLIGKREKIENVK